MIRFALVAFLLLALSGCTTPSDPFPEGDIVPAPWGYHIHCNDYPESIFCVQDDN